MFSSSSTTRTRRMSPVSVRSVAVQTGLDRLLADNGLLTALLPAGRLFGLLAHPASVDRHLVHVRHALAAENRVPTIVFGPEHGYGGEAQDMIGVADARDAGGVPIRSLYGAHFSDLSPRADDLAGIDALVVDLQDVGSRYYTFVWTAVLALRACAKAKKPVQMIVLDRPNPIGRTQIEGKLVRAKYRSFVGLERHPRAARTDARRDRRVACGRRRDRSQAAHRHRDARDRRRRRGRCVGSRLRAAVAEHADLRDDAGVPRWLRDRRDQPVRRSRDDAAVRDPRARRSSTAIGGRAS